MLDFTDMNQAIVELVEPCIDSTANFSTTFFGEHITRPFCPLHSTILSLLDDDTKRLVAIAAPRGFGKTTLIGLCYTARKALFRQAPYIVYISATASEAAQKVKTLANELTDNELPMKRFNGKFFSMTKEGKLYFMNGELEEEKKKQIEKIMKRKVRLLILILKFSLISHHLCLILCKVIKKLKRQKNKKK